MDNDPEIISHAVWLYHPCLNRRMWMTLLANGELLSPMNPFGYGATANR